MALVFGHLMMFDNDDDDGKGVDHLDLRQLIVFESQQK